MGDCASNQCQQGVCCDKACGGNCETCALGGQWTGRCVPYHVGDQGMCGTGMACAANQNCQGGLANGAGAQCFMMNPGCVSGACYGGMCQIPTQPSGFPCMGDLQCTKQPPNGSCDLTTYLCK
jgi:hypothetical protein